MSVVVLGVAPAAAQEQFSIEISPAIEGNRAVRGGQKIAVSGSVPSGTIESARLIAVDNQGSRRFENVASGKLNRTPSPVIDDSDYLVNDGGSLDGRLTLGCLFASPSAACFHAPTHDVVLEVTIGGSSGESNALRVDYTRPQLRRERQLIAPDRVLVRFSEPVRQPDGEIGADWRVNGDPVAQVEISSGGRPDCVYQPGEDARAGDTGCARILHLTEPLHEDATPDVEYWLIGHNVPMRAEHEDYADLRVLFTSQTPPIFAALDLIRPAKPHIQSVDGKTGSDGEILSNNASPAVRLTNMTAGHTARLTVTGPAGTSQHEAKVPEGANAVDVPIPALAADGSYTISALAIDPHGNRSDENDKNGPRADGERQTVTYVLDSVAPRVLFAQLVRRRTVEVEFTEPVFPNGNAGQWYVGDVPVNAQGSGAQRQLQSAVDLDNPGLLRWEPTSDEPGSQGRYGDRAGNGLAAIPGINLADLPAIPVPNVTVPPARLFTNEASTTIAGTAPDQPNLAADLFERDSDQAHRSTAVEGGKWSFNQPLATDGRYAFEVRLRDTQTDSRSPKVPVPDIIRDTMAPTVDVTRPDPAPISATNPTERRREFGVGDAVTITWTAEDPAPNDPKRPDHGDKVAITAVFADGERRLITDTVEYQPGQEQTYNYRLTRADLAGAASRELRFEVAVTDLATNRAADTSAPIVILASLIGYDPGLVQPTVIEAVFEEEVTGETTPGEWLVDELPAQSVTKRQSPEGETVVRLTVAFNDDPNATPLVQYQPLAANPAPLRSTDGRSVSTQPRNARDLIAPALTAQVPTATGPIDAQSVTFRGTTDQTSRPNTISAFQTDEDGVPQGSAIAQVVAGNDGDWELVVPLERNTVNHIVVRATDPSGNVSARLPNPPYTIIEDSIAPVVRVTSPASGTQVPRDLDIRWETLDANPHQATLEYRTNTGSWETIVTNTQDDGHHPWRIPDALREEIFSIRVTATDKVAKSGSGTADGLHMDLIAPVLLKARATGAQVVELTFDEAVTITADSGFGADGAGVRRVKGDDTKWTLILRKAVATTTPTVTYSGSTVTDASGNQLAETEVVAKRSFAFAVRKLDGERLSKKRVRLRWRDPRNDSDDLRGYRIYRDGAPIETVDTNVRRFVDRVEGKHRYTVRAVDDRGRVSSQRRVTVGKR